MLLLPYLEDIAESRSLGSQVGGRTLATYPSRAVPVATWQADSVHTEIMFVDANSAMLLPSIAVARISAFHSQPTSPVQYLLAGTA